MTLQSVARTISTREDLHQAEHFLTKRGNRHGTRVFVALLLMRRSVKRASNEGIFRRMRSAHAAVLMIPSKQNFFSRTRVENGSRSGIVIALVRIGLK